MAQAAGMQLDCGQPVHICGTGPVAAGEEDDNLGHHAVQPEGTDQGHQGPQGEGGEQCDSLARGGEGKNIIR